MVIQEMQFKFEIIADLVFKMKSLMLDNYSYYREKVRLRVDAARQQVEQHQPNSHSGQETARLPIQDREIDQS